MQADSAAASTILRGLVDVAIIGADRIAANGDTANKVGSVAIALACQRAGIPFIVAAPSSTVDLSILREAREAALSLGRGTVGDNVMYFETGQGSALSAGAHSPFAHSAAPRCTRASGNAGFRSTA